MSDIHESVRNRYRQAAIGADDCCGDRQSKDAGGGCCGGSDGTGEASCCGSAGSTEFGYTIEELRLLPDGADLGLGCGNPTALAGLTPGETVVDLGSGGGIDCLLAAARVGDAGHVIGVDMTSEMVQLARRNAERSGATNVEFRLGEIEHLPIADEAANVIISNCVINLAPEKDRVLAEAYRVLSHGGRLLVSDLVLDDELPDSLRANMALLTGCVAGAMPREDFLAAMRRVGFTDVHIEAESEYLKGDHLAGLAREAGISEQDAALIAERLRSVSVYARKSM
jgi:SAM-dependent methyltransferase